LSGKNLPAKGTVLVLFKALQVALGAEKKRAKKGVRNCEEFNHQGAGPDSHHKKGLTSSRKTRRKGSGERGESQTKKKS